MARNYDHKKIEKKWQKEWEKAKLHETPDTKKGKDNFYLLVEFPYPSGNLHVGHWYAFAVPDILVRKLHMEGKNVLYPIGFDAFGLPAENAAIKNKLNPRTWTEGNIKHMKEQIRSMGTSFDWSREVITADPAYYRWTQWLFLQFFKKSLAYQKDTPVNWCPNDKTVLANEQVVNGKCERCGVEVEQRNMLQWNLKISDYADRLIDDLEPLDWPKEIKESQKNWIGRSEGTEIDFPLLNVDSVKRIVILHGRNGTPDNYVFPWLKQELEKRGYIVEVPALPNTQEPNDEEQADYVQKNCTLDAKTAIVGQSFGGVVAMRLLERGVKVQRVVMATVPFSGSFNDGKVRKSVTAACKKGFDFEKIRRNAQAFIVLRDLRDEIILHNEAEIWKQNLNGMLINGHGTVPHFSGEKEPDMLLASTPTIRVFTTRPDTLFGATYLVLAPEHPMVENIKHKTKNIKEIDAYITAAGKKTELERQENKEKTGVKLEGVEAINPATGEKIPLFIADYVLGHYGTGAIMAVPAHDERDFEFARKYSLPTKEVVVPDRIDIHNPPRDGKQLVPRRIVQVVVCRPSDGKIIVLHWSHASWKTLIIGGVEGDESLVDAAKREVLEETGYKNIQFVKELGDMYAGFFASHKDENRRAHATGMLFELVNDERDEVSEEEKKKHTASWMTVTEALKDLIGVEPPIFLSRFDKDNWVYTENGTLVNSGEFDGMDSEEAKRKVTEKFGRAKTTYKMRDWVVSRQRYWGVPIPIVHCEKCGTVAVPDDQLPVELPAIDDYLPTGDGKSPLAKAKDWMMDLRCPSCGGEAVRETDTLDTFVDSSWYFLRYTDPKNEREFASKEKMAHWMPVSLYSGGAEHTTMHLLYSRFWQKAMFDLGLVKDSEPYKKRMNRSLILGPDGQKMSKSRGNVIDPDEVVANLGADTVRMYLAFIGPYNEVSSYPWNPDGVVGVRRFLERVWRLQEKIQEQKTENKELEMLLHKTIKKVEDDIAALKFNTAISQLMIFLNAAEKEGGIGKKQWATLLKLLAPFAPHMAEELWHEAGHDSSIHLEKWPECDTRLLRDKEVTIAVQINGKARVQVTAPADASEAEVRKLAEEAAAKWIEGREVVRVIYVPNRLVNLVLVEK
ncbi:hypothetical protein A3A38_00855 [Candidatus Kaiserbacteria bacterium RIFCSPLOWO2_01_FULL_53_17]|uniref:Leucine--tRNA ligase n=1 Tax=Candidatus Kaiserbacteria bacterium RIFCSPLOWO2_01_FULL_53_17 TaxID=1798511 RepID=A0A1F6EGH0_9BACT|nr:MAG: hypothetical protein A3A38_00855 [Candidatus Kaiserbacteria bacterium RIFCSPLOWO2_01_FULL_53_17]